jgi:predicted tellurium resistance membrane protein TerC
MKKKELGKAATKSFKNVLLQVIVIDLVFSFDSYRRRDDQWS